MEKRRIRKEVYYALPVIALCVIITVLVVSSLKAGSKAADLDGSLPAAVNKTVKTSSQESAQASSLPVLPVVAPLEKTVVIDPGHGGPDPGAIGVGGVREKDLNLAIANKLKALLLKAGFAVIMTREDDRSIYDTWCVTLAQMKTSDLDNRVKIIHNYPGAIFISIHQNSNDNAEYYGAQVYYSTNNSGSKKLASQIQSEIKKALEPNNKRSIQPPGVLRVLLKAPTPAILVECGFISNPADVQNLVNGDYQDKLASIIADAAKAYYIENAGK